MGGLSFQNLPATQVNEIRGTLQNQWKIEAQSLDKSWFSNRGQFETAKAKLNAKYQRLEFDALTKLQQQQQEQEQVKKLIGQGTQGMGREEEATLRMNLGPEAERLVFPAAGQPFSISQITSKATMESIQDFAEAAPTKGLFWTRESKEPKTQQGLTNQYLEWRGLAQYDALNPLRQRQLDMQWDAYMAGDERFDKWWSNKEKREPAVEIKAMRTPGKIGKMMRGRLEIARGTTPFGRSVAKNKPRATLPTEPLTFGMEVAHRLMAPASKPEQRQTPIRQRNKRTGQERISYDGGRTWQTIGK